MENEIIKIVKKPKCETYILNKIAEKEEKNNNLYLRSLIAIHKNCSYSFLQKYSRDKSPIIRTNVVKNKGISKNFLEKMKKYETNLDILFEIEKKIKGVSIGR